MLATFMTEALSLLVEEELLLLLVEEEVPEDPSLVVGSEVLALQV